MIQSELMAESKQFGGIVNFSAFLFKFVFILVFMRSRSIKAVNLNFCFLEFETGFKLHRNVRILTFSIVEISKAVRIQTSFKCKKIKKSHFGRLCSSTI